MDPDKKCIHIGDVSELGKLVARAFEQPEVVGQGQPLSQASGMVSWTELLDTLNAQGHALKYNRVPPEVFDTFFPGASELREMFAYFEGHTYFGPDAETKIALANQIYADGFTPFAKWAEANMKP
jgi:hypothetical protein